MKESIKAKIESVFCKNTIVREWFITKTFKKISLKKYLTKKGYMPKRYFIPLVGLMASLPFITEKLYGLFPTHTLLTSLFMGLVAFGVALLAIGVYAQDYSGKNKEIDESFISFLLFLNIFVYLVSFITFMNIGWKLPPLIGMGVYITLLPGFYALCYFIDTIKYYIKKSEVPLELSSKLTHDDHKMLAKFLEKDEMEVFLDNYKTYNDLPYAAMKEENNNYKVTHTKKDYLDSLYKE